MIFFFQRGDQFFDRKALGRFLFVVFAGFGKPTGTAEKFQIVIIFPGDDISLFDVIQRADEFHAPEIFALNFGRHALHLRAV